MKILKLVVTGLLTSILFGIVFLLISWGWYSLKDVSYPFFKKSQLYVLIFLAVGFGFFTTLSRTAIFREHKSILGVVGSIAALILLILAALISPPENAGGWIILAILLGLSFTGIFIFGNDEKTNLTKS